MVTKTTSWLAGLAVAAMFALGLAAATPAMASTGSTLINVPASRVCHDSEIKVGVWAQSGTSWADRQYSVDVWSPHGDHAFHSAGHAPESPKGWWFWYVKAWQYGTYHTVYHTWHSGHMYANTFSSYVRYC